MNDQPVACGSKAWLAVVLWAVLAGCVSTAPTKEGGTMASADGSPIVYGTRGKGEPVIVFVHCWTCDHSFWQAQIDYFSRRYQVVWLDLAGHGASGSRRQRYTMQAFGQDVVAVVNRIGAREVILVGHSMGGPVVVEAAKRLGDRVIGIVGVDTFYTPFEYPTSQEAIVGFLTPFEKDYRGASEKLVRSMFTPQADPAVVDTIVTRMSRTDAQVGISAMYELFEWHAHEAPADLQRFADILYNINAAPTGTESPLHAHVILVPGVGHFVAQVKPEAFNRALSSIITRLTAEEGG